MISERLYFLAMAEAADLEAHSHAASMSAAHCDPFPGTAKRLANVAFYQDLAQSCRARAEWYRQYAKDAQCSAK